MIRVAGREHPWHSKMTVAELLRELRDPHDYPVVRVNDHYVSRPRFETTPVPDGAQVYLIPMIAGG